MSEASTKSDAAAITTGFRRGASIVRCAGEVTMASAATLRETLEKLVADHPPVLVVDLGDVGFFGSSGISALVAAQERADRAGVLLAVVAGGRPVLRPLEVTTVDRVLTLYPSVDEALDALDPVTAGPHEV